jgi:hypothetical protein
MTKKLSLTSIIVSRMAIINQIFEFLDFKRELLCVSNLYVLILYGFQPTHPQKLTKKLWDRPIDWAIRVESSRILNVRN